jgi:hypothetical protein
VTVEEAMIERRNLVGGGLLAGAAALVGARGASAAAQRDPDDDNDGAIVAKAIADLQAVIERQHAVSPELERIREQQRIFLKANQKYPDFIEVGVTVWEDVYDWHVRHRQPISMTRTGDGRYVMTVMFTTLILRPEQTGSYIGFGFDAR